MKRFLCLFSLTCILAAYVFATSTFPTDMLVGKSLSQRYYYIELITDKFLPAEDSATFFKRITDLEELADDNNDPGLKDEADLLRLAYYTHHYRNDSALCLRQINKLFSIAGKDKNAILTARVNEVAARYFWEKNYELAFEYMHAEYATIHNLRVDEYPARQKSIYNLGLAYWYFHDYEQAMKYMKEASRSDVFGQSLYYTLQATNTVGLCYQKLDNLDSADYYFSRANAIAVSVGNNAWDGITSGNLGYNYFVRQEYDTAIVLLKKDLDLSVERGDWGCASGSLITLAEINIMKNNPKLAEEQLVQAARWIELAGEFPRYKNLYTVYVKLYEKNGQQNIAESYRDSARFVKDSLAEKFSVLQALRWKQKSELKIKRETEQMKQKLTKFITAFMVVIASVIIIYSVLRIILQWKGNLLHG